MLVIVLGRALLPIPSRTWLLPLGLLFGFLFFGHGLGSSFSFKTVPVDSNSSIVVLAVIMTPQFLGDDKAADRTSLSPRPDDGSRAREPDPTASASTASITEEPVAMNDEVFRPGQAPPCYEAMMPREPSAELLQPRM